jgi:HK97 family phage major capsid protein
MSKRLQFHPIGGGGDPEEVAAELAAQIKSKLDGADAIVEKAQDEKRQLTEDEKSAVGEALKEAEPLQVKLAEAKAEAAMWKRVREGVGSVDDGKGAQASGKGDPKIEVAGSWGEQFTESESFKSVLGGGVPRRGVWGTGAVELKGPSAVMGAKALLTEDTASGGRLIQPETQPGILPLLFRRPTVADLLADGTTNSNTVRYLKETTATNAAAAVAEGATKPESTLIFDQVDEPVKKIATLLPVTDEMLEDVAQVRSYIDQRLRLFLILTEEDQLLNGSGVGANLTGLLNRAGLQTQAKGADSAIDAIYKAITKVRQNSFLEPDAVVIEPADWQDIRLAKDLNGAYYGGGPFGPMYGDNLWGLRVVVTSAIATGTALVGAYKTAAQLFRRGGVAVEASNSHSTFFAENKTAIRAEERLALAVYRPAAFCTVTGI